MHQPASIRRAARRPRQADRRETGLRYTEQSFEEIWADFESQRTLEFGGHTDPSWRGRFDTSAAFIIPVAGEPLKERLTPIREALDDFDFVKLHPDDFMHLTLSIIGFVSETSGSANTVTQERLHRISENARDALDGFGEFTFRLDNLNAFPGVAFVEGHDAERIRDLTKILKTACSLEHVVWPPHLTVAYFHVPDGTSAPDELIETIEEFREWPVGEVEVKEVKLSLLDLESDYKGMRVFDRIPL